MLGAEDYDAEVRFSGQTAVFMGIFPLPNANAIDVIKRIRAEMALVQKELPTGLQARVAYDATDYINNAIQEVVNTLGETLLIVVIIIFLFLGSLRSVLVPVIAIPVSLIGGIFLMQVFGFTINLLTLLAIVLSVGLVVDDAIVVVENVERHLREGRSPFDAAILGARELIGPIIAMTVTLIGRVRPHRIPGRADRLAVPRVRLHPGRRGDHFRRGGADPVADDDVQAAERRGRASTGLPADQRRFRAPASGILRPGARQRPERPPGGLPDVGRAVGAGGADVDVFCRGTGPERGSGGDLRHRRCFGQRHARPDQRSSPPPPTTCSQTCPRPSSPSRSPSRTSGFGGGMVVKPWERARAHRFSNPARGPAEAASHSGHSNVPGHATRLARRRPVSGRVHHRLDRRHPGNSGHRPAGSNQGDAERDVRVPADHRREDRPAADRNRHRPRQGGRAGASICSRSAPTSARPWAATSSTASTSPAAATRSFRRWSGWAASIPTNWKTFTSPGRTGN